MKDDGPVAPLSKIYLCMKSSQTWLQAVKIGNIGYMAKDILLLLPISSYIAEVVYINMSAFSPAM